MELLGGGERSSGAERIKKPKAAASNMEWSLGRKGAKRRVIFDRLSEACV
jgi:hypothetical protein